MRLLTLFCLIHSDDLFIITDQMTINDVEFRHKCIGHSNDLMEPNSSGVLCVEVYSLCVRVCACVLDKDTEDRGILWDMSL